MKKERNPAPPGKWPHPPPAPPPLGHRVRRRMLMMSQAEVDEASALMAIRSATEVEAKAFRITMGAGEYDARARQLCRPMVVLACAPKALWMSAFEVIVVRGTPIRDGLVALINELESPAGRERAVMLGPGQGMLWVHRRLEAILDGAGPGG